VGGSVLLFALVDDHIHLVLLCDRDATGARARAVLLALRTSVAAGLGPAHVSEVRGRAHLEWLVRYLLTQPAHHGLSEHAALTTGSCFPELVGARVVPGLSLRLSASLPRFRLREAYSAVGLAPEPLVPVQDAELRVVGARALVTAASAAAGAPPLLGRDLPSVDTRRVVASLGQVAGIHLEELAHALGVTPDAARRIAQRPAPVELVKATRMRLALEAAATAAGVAAANAAVARAKTQTRADAAQASLGAPPSAKP